MSNSILLYLVYELYSIICYSVEMFELSVIVFRMPGYGVDRLWCRFGNWYSECQALYIYYSINTIGYAKYVSCLDDIE